jgi:hypothetical protein
MSKLFLVEDNNAPSMVLTLVRKVAGSSSTTAIDVTGCTVDLIINLNGTVTNTGHTACTLTTPASGIVTYTIHATDFATPGLYNCETRITYADATVETIYEKFQVQARAKLS